MIEIVWEYCSNCVGTRKHELLHHETVEWQDEIMGDFPVSGANLYDMLKCCGCEKVILRHQSWFSEEIDPKTGEPEIAKNCYPSLTFRRPPSWVSELFSVVGLDNFIEPLIREIYIALQNDAPRLATMGIRALLEQVMIDKVGDNGTFKKNLDEFQAKGFVSNSQRQVIEPVLEAGHATIHRSFTLEPKDVGLLMDIAESIIESLYINEFRAKGITKKIPPRNK